MNSEESPKSKRERIEGLIKFCKECLNDGALFDQDQIIEKHPDLMPELGRELTQLTNTQLTNAHAAPADTGPADPDASDATRASDATHASDRMSVTMDSGSGDSQKQPMRPAIEGFKITREIGRGAQGKVFEAIDLQTHRKVAIKVIFGSSTADIRSRFEREILILAQLSHPGIVQVITKGVTANHELYLVMPFVPGITLGQWIKLRFTSHATANPPSPPRAAPVEDPAPPHPDQPHPTQPHRASETRSVDMQMMNLTSVDPIEALDLFHQICDAVNAAHLHGVVHRDLKPSNILINNDGRPYILDFGLAKPGVELRPDMKDLSSAADFVFQGTLRWAAPEQVDPATDKLDTRSDVYSLGVILYEMLTGRQPYDLAGSYEEIVNAIRTVVPLPPSVVLASQAKAGVVQINDPNGVYDSLAPSIDAIVLKSLQKRRELRHQTAGELARDIQSLKLGNWRSDAGDISNRPLVSSSKTPSLSVSAAPGLPSSSVPGGAPAPGSPASVPSLGSKRILTVLLGVAFVGVFLGWMSGRSADLGGSNVPGQASKLVGNNVGTATSLAAKQSLAVAKFTVLGQPEAADQGRIISEMLVSQIDTDAYSVFERTQLESLLAEKKFEETDVVETASATARFGRLAGIQFLVVGTVSQFEGQYYISARVVDCDNGMIHGRASVSISSAQKTQDAVARLASMMNLRKSSNAPTGEPANPSPRPVSKPNDLIDAINPNAPFNLRIRTGEGKLDYVEGEDITFVVEADRDCYVTLIARDPEGTMTLLLPNKWQPTALVRKGRKELIPLPTSGARFPIQPPHGATIVRAIATLDQLRLMNIDADKIEHEKFVSIPEGTKAIGVASRAIGVTGGADPNAAWIQERLDRLGDIPAESWTTSELVVTTHAKSASNR